MKTLLSTLSVVTLTLLLAGCASTPEGKEDEAQRVGRVLESLAFTGTTLYLQEHPEHRPAFAQAAASLSGLTAQPEIDLLHIYDALRPLPIRELKTPEATLVVGNVQIILDEFGRGTIDLDKLTYLRPAAAGLARGITRALGSGTAEPPVPEARGERREASAVSPTRPSSLTSRLSGDHVELHTPAAPAAVQLQLSTTLAGWEPAVAVTRTHPGPLTIRDYEIDNPQKFYRLSPR